MKHKTQDQCDDSLCTEPATIRITATQMNGTVLDSAQLCAGCANVIIAELP